MNVIPFASLFTFTILLFLFNIHLYLFSYLDYIYYLFEPNHEESFDYIIVGCGTAGSLIAHRLSARKDISFAVLEAGGTGGPLLNPPVLGPLLHTTIYDWQYLTVSQNNACLSMKDRKCKWASGKIVGGSAKINNMVHYSKYADEIVQWFSGKYSYETMLKEIEHLELNDLPVDDIVHKTILSSTILNAAKELNHNKSAFEYARVNQKNGARWTTSHTLYKSFPKNGRMIPNAHVEKILFDNKKSKGVVYQRYGREFILKAKKGVILAAGAIGSPKLLLLSGIGPSRHLTSLNIDLVKDLPVGRNLMDHVATGLDLIMLNQTLNTGIIEMLNPINGWKYFYAGNGSWTTGGCETVAYFKTEAQLSVPNLQFMILPMGLSTDHGVHLRKTIGITKEVWENYFSKGISKETITILPIVLHPKSKGFIELASKNSNEQPIINPLYFSQQEDLDVIFEGIKIIKDILKTKSMKSLGAHLNPNIFPGCENYTFDSEKYWKCYTKHLTLSVFHPGGTCRMGFSSEVTTVVDHNFRVLDIENLFVVDASIFPELPSGNPNAAVALIAQLFSTELLLR